MEANNGKELSLIRIIYVEDKEHDQAAFRRAFKKAPFDCEITVYARGEEVLERLGSDASQFDILVADFGLPGMSGLDMFKELMDRKIGIPTVILTGTGSEQIAVDALKAGAYDYILKDPDQGYLNLLPVVVKETVKKHRDRLSREQAEKALLESEEKYREIVQTTTDGFWLSDKDGKLLDVNAAYCQMSGYTRDELIEMSFKDLEEKESGQEVASHIQKVIESGSDRFESIHRRKDGSTFEVEVSTNFIKINNGAFISFIRDITDRKQAEEALRSEKLLTEEYINSLPGLFYVFDEERIVKWNKHWETVSGYSADEISQKYGPDYFEGSDKTLIADRMRKVFVDGISDAEAEIVTKQGKRIPYYFTGIRKEFNGKPHLVGLGIDITERKQIEETLQREYARTTNILDSIPDGVYIVSKEHSIEYINPVIEQEFGPADGRKCYEYFHDLTEACPWCKNADVFAGKSVRWEWYSSKNDRYYDLYDSPFKNVDGSISKIEIFHDITERKQAEENVMLLTTAMEQSAEGIALTDLEGNLTYLNKSFATMHGYNTQELIGKRLSVFHTPEQMSSVDKALQRCMDHGEFNGEVWRVRKDGTIFPSLMHNSIVFNESGNSVAMLGTLRDITDIKKNERELKDARDNLEKRVEERTNDLLLASNKLEEEIEQRKQTEDVLKFSQKTLAISNTYSQMTPLLEAFVREFEVFTGCDSIGIRVLDEGDNIPYEAYSGFSDSFYELESPLSIKTDQCMCINVIKGETDPDLPFYTEGGSFYMNGTTKFLATVSEEDKGSTRNTCNQVGYESVALIPIRMGDKYLGLVHLADHKENMVSLQKVQAVEQVAWYLAIAMGRVVSDEKVHSSEDKFRSLVTNIPDVIWTTNSEGKTTFISQNIDRVFGYSQEEIYKEDGNIWPGRIHPEDAGRVEKAFKELFEQGNMFDVEYRIKRKDGEWIWATDRSIAVYERDGVKYADGIFSDLSKRKQAEEALRASEERFRSMMETMTDAVYICSSDFRVEYMNPAMIKRTGCNTIGEFCYKTINGLDEKCSWCLHSTVQRGKRAVSEMLSPIDNRFYSVSHSPIYNDNGTISKMTIFRDVTEEKLLHEQLVRSERFAATGQLAATIAHEINSPLQAISFLLSSFKDENFQGKSFEEDVDLLIEAFGNIRDTVKHLLDLNRPGQEDKQKININDIIKKTVALLQSNLKKNKVRIKLEQSSKIPMTNVSPQQMNHVFLNMINNSIEAICEQKQPSGNWGNNTSGREINIKTSLRKKDIIIQISDTGPGIPPEDINHIFDPFFTRKKKMGIGVGLSVCAAIVEEHCGTIKAENSPESGAVFTIILPVNDDG